MKIGDTIKIKNLDQCRGLAGKEAEIVDILDSTAEQCRLYRVRLTGAGTIPSTLLPEEALEVIDDVSYYHEIECLNNVVLARFYEERNGVAKELARGHGHLIHTGALGIAQATSYAMRRVYEAMQQEE